jgi:hypothetical protein
MRSGVRLLPLVVYHLWNRFWPGVSTRDHPLSLNTPISYSQNLAHVSPRIAAVS